MRRLQEHPCFDEAAHFQYGRLHLPIAPCCNIHCRYCERRYDCVHESRPGVTSRVLEEGEALRYAKEYLNRHEETTVIGIAGPGEPLANEATFRVLAEISGVIKCVSTNGLLLPEKLRDLEQCGVSALTVTVNTLDPCTALRLYADTDVDALLKNQQEGIAAAVQRGMHVKMNTVLVPGVNDTELEVTALAVFAKRAGVEVMNINSLIPCGELQGLAPIEQGRVQELRRLASAYVRQFCYCRQCRADAAGIPGCAVPSGLSPAVGSAVRAGAAALV